MIAIKSIKLTRIKITGFKILPTFLVFQIIFPLLYILLRDLLSISFETLFHDSARYLNKSNNIYGNIIK